MTTSAHPFPAFTFRLLPSSGLSTPVSRRFLFLPCILRFLSSPSSCTCGYSASCSSFLHSIGSASQWLSQRPDLSSRILRIFPFHPVWFPIQSFRFCLFGSLFVSFRSSLIRSHSRSSGARFFSPSSPPVPFRVCPCRSLPFVHVRFRASSTQPLLLPFPSSRFPLTVGTPVPIFPPFFPPVSMRQFPVLVLSFPAIPFPAIEVSPHRCYFFRRPFTSGSLLRPRPLPLAFALGSGT